MNGSRNIAGSFFLAVAASALFFAPPACAASLNSRIRGPINDAERVTLGGNIPPLARRRFDRGRAPDSLPMERMLLVLKRSSQQEQALENLLVEQQDKTSPAYRRWLTPEEFGGEFGVSSSDLQKITGWLSAQGFEVNRVSNSRTVIEFSGTAGQVRQTFSAEIHQYVIRGKSYWANSTNPQIPAALAPVVAGIASLNNFPRTPMLKKVGVFQRSRETGKYTPLFTFTSNGQTFYPLGPGDFDKIYNVPATPNGTGETIAIVGDSNINPQDDADFRSIFGLPANPVNVILDGPDPGIVAGSETEADLDTEWAGAVAPGATIDLVVSEDTETTAGVDLSALYIIDNNLAPILSESFGACEASLGSAGNAFESGMFEQAAAEGITVLVAAGDTGSAGCDNSASGVDAAQHGLAISGTASSPFDVAVGGTDFDLNPTNATTYFSATNNSTTQASAKSYIPEITWNDSCASGGSATNCLNPSSQLQAGGIDLTAGSGGPSSCTSQDVFGNCLTAYSKPAWQTGSGVPNDSVRDIPDISMFAGDGLNGSFYIICESDQNPGNAPCSLASPYSDFFGVGGTSAPTPAFAGVMALINQKYGRQGDADFTLYPLAAMAKASGNYCTSNSTAVSKSTCIFYDIVTGHNDTGTDITPGNNTVACLAGSPDCSNQTGSGYGYLTANPPASGSNSTTAAPAWQTATEYDYASGLGSINVANLLAAWNTVTFKPTSTTLAGVTPTTITHGQSAAATITVKTTSTGTPSGDVELMATPTAGGASLGVGTFTLTGGAATGSTKMIPGGTWNLTAHYQGDGFFGLSDSPSPGVTVTVGKENSSTDFEVAIGSFNSLTGTFSYNYCTSGCSTPYGSIYLLRADILNAAGAMCAPVNTSGEQTQPASGCPTGTVTWTDNGAAPPASEEQGNPADDVPGTLPLNSQGYAEDAFIQFSTGSHSLQASYSGDNSFNASTSSSVSLTVTKAPTTTSFVSPPSSVAAGTPFSLNVAVLTSSSGVGPTGTVEILNGSSPLGNASCSPSNFNPSTGTPALCQATVNGLVLTASASLTAEYSGDTNYTTSTSSATQVNVAANFAMAATPTSNSVSPGSSASYTITATAAGGFTGTVNFTCSVASASGSIVQDMPTCSLNPASAAVGVTPGSTILEVSTTAPSLFAPFGSGPRGDPWMPVALFLSLSLVAAAGAWFARSRRRPLATAILTGALFIALAGLASCGGGGNSGPPPNPGTPAGNYTVTVTGTSGTVSNSTPVTLTVQ